MGGICLRVGVSIAEVVSALPTGVSSVTGVLLSTSLLRPLSLCTLRCSYTSWWGVSPLDSSQECPCPVTGFLGFSIWQGGCAHEYLCGLSSSGILHVDTMLSNSTLAKVKFWS